MIRCCLIFALSPFAAFADTPSGFALTYEAFEAAVPHLDLETCPGALAAEDRFCRITIGHDALHVFAFSYAGDSPLVGFQSWPSENLGSLLK